jgi:hypothetical protein
VIITKSRAQIGLKSSHKLSSNIATSLRLGVSFHKRTDFDLESYVKWRLSEHVKTYSGLSYTIDGWAVLLGIKIAGFKIKLPFIFMKPLNEIVDDKDEHNLNYWKLLAIFVGATYGLKRYVSYKE